MILKCKNLRIFKLYNYGEKRNDNNLKKVWFQVMFIPNLNYLSDCYYNIKAFLYGGQKIQIPQLGVGVDVPGT